MDQLMRKNKSLTSDKAFTNSRIKAARIFWNKLDDLMKDFGNSKSKKLIIFIDKTHPPNALPGTFDNLYNFQPENVKMKIICILPKILSKFEFKKGNGLSFPFSLTFFFTCLDRIKNRKTHATLVYEGVKTIETLLGFISFYKNLTLSDLTNEFDHHIEIPLHYETEKSDSQFSKELIDSFISAIKNTSTRKGFQTKEEYLSKFKAIFEKQEFNFGEVKSDVVKSSTLKALDECFKLFGPIEKKSKNEASGSEIQKNEDSVENKKVPGVIGQKNSNVKDKKVTKVIDKPKKTKQIEEPQPKKAKRIEEHKDEKTLLTTNEAIYVPKQPKQKSKPSKKKTLSQLGA